MASHQLDYSGKRHARITTSMRRLQKTMRLVLVELRWRIPDGDTKHISNATLASATGLSEASVSVYVRLLAGEPVTVKGETLQPPQHRFITRQRRADGPGFEITMLPPPELRPRTRPTPTPQVVQMEFAIEPAEAEPNVCAGSLDDPLLHGVVSGIRTPESVAEEGSSSDPSILHESMPTQQQPGDRRETARDDEQAAPPRTIYPNCFEPLAARLAARFPSYPEAVITAGIVALRGRRDVQAGRTNLEATLYYCLRENKPIYSQAELDARSLAHQERSHDSAAAGAAGARQGPQPNQLSRPGGRAASRSTARPGSTADRAARYQSLQAPPVSREAFAAYAPLRVDLSALRGRRPAGDDGGAGGGGAADCEREVHG